MQIRLVMTSLGLQLKNPDLKLKTTLYSTTNSTTSVADPDLQLRRGPMNVEFCEDNSGTSKKMRHPPLHIKVLLNCFTLIYSSIAFSK